MEKEVCGKCKINIATWCLMCAPRVLDPFYCNNCVPRGCDCNNKYTKDYIGDFEPDNPPTELKYFNRWKWIIPGEIWRWLDEDGRENPCCEFEYEKEGWNIEKYEERDTYTPHNWRDPVE